MNKVFPGTLTAADIMTTHVAAVTATDSVRDVMAVLVESHVSGAPVVDSKGRCMGVVSATDILSLEQDHSESADEANDDVAQVFDPDSQRWESIRLTAFALEELADTPVESVMTSDVVSVKPDSRIHVVAKLMIDREVHRVVVLDEQRKLVGIITATDFVRAFVKHA